MTDKPKDDQYRFARDNIKFAPMTWHPIGTIQASDNLPDIPDFLNRAKRGQHE